MVTRKGHRHQRSSVRARMHQIRWSRLRHERPRKTTSRERTQLRRKIKAVMTLRLELQHFWQVTLRTVRWRRTIKLLQTSSILDRISFTAKVAVQLNTVDDLVLEGLDCNQRIVNVQEVHEAVAGLLVWVHLQSVLLHNAIHNLANLRENVVQILFIDLVSNLQSTKETRQYARTADGDATLQKTYALRQKAHVDLRPCILLGMTVTSLA